MPRGIPNNKAVDTNELDTGKTTTAEMPLSGAIDRSAMFHEDDIEVSQAHGLSEKAALLAFFEEPVEIEVHESTDPNAEPFVDLHCNGVPQWIVRGQPVVVKRKFVNILATCKPQSIATQVGVQGDQVRNSVSRHSALRYPFRVIRDDNPRGAAWLRETLQNG